MLSADLCGYVLQSHAQLNEYAAQCERDLQASIDRERDLDGNEKALRMEMEKMRLRMSNAVPTQHTQELEEQLRVSYQKGDLLVAEVREFLSRGESSRVAVVKLSEVRNDVVHAG